MKARLAPLLVVGMLAATAATGAATQPRRALESYAPTDDDFTVGAPQEEAVVGTGSVESQYDFPIRKGETSVSAMILDDSERPVSGIVTQWRPTDRREAGPASASTYEAVTWQRFCERTDAPVALKPKYPVRIIVMEGTCMDGTPSVPTTGDIVLDFHRG
jgi:hypothetical protein